MRFGTRAALVLVVSAALALGFAGTASSRIVIINGNARGAHARLLQSAVVLPSIPSVVLPAATPSGPNIDRYLAEVYEAIRIRGDFEDRVLFPGEQPE
jgi:hypothetical protein